MMHHLENDKTSIAVLDISDQSAQAPTDDDYQLQVDNITPTYLRTDDRSEPLVKNQVLCSRNIPNTVIRYNMSVEGEGGYRFALGPISLKQRSWIDHQESPLYYKYQQGLRYVYSRLKSFDKLKQGWDSYNAKPITLPAIVRAMQLFSLILRELHSANRDIGVPFVGPRIDGGVGFEWETLYKEFIVSVPASLEAPTSYLKVDKSVMKELEEEGVITSDFDLARLVVQWLTY